jgi:tRNA A37 threonylcarbamoyladenosine synthetase subunit TsaC/SUA5/YrdC
MREKLEHAVDLIIDGGPGGLEASTVVELENGVAHVTRAGKGDPAPFT